MTGEAVCLCAASGAGHMESINRSLARIDLTKSAPPFVPAMEEKLLEKGETAGEVFTVFFSPDAQEDFQQLLCACLHRRMDFVWFCPESAAEPVQIWPELERYTRRLVWDED